MEEIKRDMYGLVGQPDINFPGDLEGGDSLNWTCHAEALKYYVDDRSISRLNLFESKKHPGFYLRHPAPNQSKYGFASYCEGNWRGVESRDQMSGKLCLMVAKDWVYDYSLQRTFKAHKMRWLLFANNTIHNGDSPEWYTKKAVTMNLVSYYSNTKKQGSLKYKLPDITGPDIWALYIRAYRNWWLYPLLTLFDVHLLLTALTKLFKKDTDVISFVMKIITACEVMPTLPGWVASKVCSATNILERLKKYWCGWRSQPGMYDLYVPLVKKHFR